MNVAQQDRFYHYPKCAAHIVCVKRQSKIKNVNQGVVTINLVDVALSSYGDFDKFNEIFEKRLELCHRALQARHNRLANATSDVAPILWQNGALARLEPGESIHKLLHNGYSTLSLGYIGIYETTKLMRGVSHTTPEGHEFAIKVMRYLKDRANKWKPLTYHTNTCGYI